MIQYQYQQNHLINIQILLAWENIQFSSVFYFTKTSKLEGEKVLTILHIFKACQSDKVIEMNEQFYH